MRLASERSGLALVALTLAGCGPMVGSGQGSAEGSAEGSASSEGEGASSTTTTATVDDTGSTGSTGDDGTTEPPLAGWCLHGTPLPELASSDELLAVYDADADGRDEVWMAGPVKGLEQWSRIWAYELGDGPRLTPILEVVRLGSIQAMVSKPK